MIAAKIVCDDTYSNRIWVMIGLWQGMFQWREIYGMERDMFGFLQWNMHVVPEDLRSFEREVREIYSLPPPYEHGVQMTLRVGGLAPYPSLSASPHMSMSTPPLPDGDGSSISIASPADFPVDPSALGGIFQVGNGERHSNDDDDDIIWIPSLNSSNSSL